MVSVAVVGWPLLFVEVVVMTVETAEPDPEAPAVGRIASMADSRVTTLDE